MAFGYWLHAHSQYFSAQSLSGTEKEKIWRKLRAQELRATYVTNWKKADRDP